MPVPRKSEAEIAVLSRLISLLDQIDPLLELVRSSVGEVVHERATQRPRQTTGVYRIVGGHLRSARAQLRCARRRLSAKQKLAQGRRRLQRE